MTAKNVSRCSIPGSRERGAEVVSGGGSGTEAVPIETWGRSTTDSTFLSWRVKLKRTKKGGTWTAGGVVNGLPELQSEKEKRAGGFRHP